MLFIFFCVFLEFLTAFSAASFVLWAVLLAYLGLAACLLFPARYGPLIWTLSSSIIFTTLGCEWLYAIHEEYGYLALRNICFQILSLLLLLTYVKDESDLLLYAWSIVASKVTALLKQLLAAMIVVTVPRLACLYGQKSRPASCPARKSWPVVCWAVFMFTWFAKLLWLKA